MVLYPTTGHTGCSKSRIVERREVGVELFELSPVSAAAIEGLG